MNFSSITATYAVAPQIEPDDFDAIVEAGFKAVICNRPDMENPSYRQSEIMAQAAADAGLNFYFLPLTHQTMNAENVAKQFDFVEKTGGPVLAYCASGTRCSVIWALSQAGKQSADDILNQAAKAGYDLSGLRNALG